MSSANVLVLSAAFEMFCMAQAFSARWCLYFHVKKKSGVIFNRECLVYQILFSYLCNIILINKTQ